MASDRDSRVIGYFAYVSPAEVVCTGDACAGSESAMRDYLIELNPDREGMHTIRKTRFAEIMFGIRSGAAQHLAVQKKDGAQGLILRRG